jgi:cbb3-type cytochrome oxidase maturation protein
LTGRLSCPHADDCNCFERKPAMDILYLLIPLSVVLALAILGGLAWAIWRGQFESLDAEGERILHHD